MTVHLFTPYTTTRQKSLAYYHIASLLYMYTYLQFYIGIFISNLPRRPLRKEDPPSWCLTYYLALVVPELVSPGKDKI